MATTEEEVAGLLAESPPADAPAPDAPAGGTTAADVADLLGEQQAEAPAPAEPMAERPQRMTGGGKPLFLVEGIPEAPPPEWATKQAEGGLGLDYSTPEEKRAQTRLEENARIAEAYGKGSMVDPNADAEARRASSVLGIPLGVVKARGPEFKATLAAQDFDVEAWRKKNPELRKLALDTGLGEMVTRDQPLAIFQEALNKYHDVRDWLDPWLESVRLPEEQGPTAARLRQDARDQGRAKPTTQAFRHDIRSETVGTGLERTAKLLYARFVEGGAQTEINLAHTDLRAAMAENFLHPGSADESAILDRIHELKRQAGPIDFPGSGTGEATLATIAQAVSSQVGVFKEAGPWAAAGGAAGAVIGGVAGIEAGPAGVVAGGKAGGAAGFSFGLQAGVFMGSSAIEGGSSLEELLALKTDDGKKLDPMVAVGGSYLLGSAKGAVEVASFGLLLKSAGFGGGVKELLGKDATFRAIVGRIGKAWAEEAAGEGAEEGVQFQVDEVGKYLLASLKDGRLQADYGGTFDETMKNIEGGVIGGLALGGAASSLHLVGQLQARADAMRGQGYVLGLAGLKDSPTTRAVPDAVVRMIEEATAKSGQKVTALHVTGSEFVRYFQDQKLDPHDAAAELLGPDGPEKLNAAVMAGGKVEVPLKLYLEKWAGGEAAHALAEDTTARASHQTAREMAAADKETEARAQKMAEEFADTGGVDPASKGGEFLDAMEKQLAKTEPLDKGSAKKSMEVMRAFVRTTTARFGSDADTVFANLKVRMEQGQAPVGAMLQDAVAAAPHADSVALSERLLGPVGKEGLDYTTRINEIHRDDIAGLLNETAWDKTPRTPGAKVLVLGTPDIKAVNDNPEGGHDTANEMLRAIGAAVGPLDRNAGRGGTAVIMEVADDANPIAGLKTEAEALASAQAVLPKGMVLEYGSGANKAEAFKAREKFTKDKRLTKDFPARGKTNYDLAGLPSLTFKPGKAASNISDTLAEQADALSPAEHFKEAYLDKRDPRILNRQGFLASGKKPWVMAIDLVGLKKDFNERFNPYLPADRQGWVGDLALAAFKDSAVRMGGNALSFSAFSGDEFAAGHKSKAELESFRDDLVADLQNTPLEFKLNGETFSIRLNFRAGIAENSYGAADRVLNRAKGKDPGRFAKHDAEASQRKARGGGPPVSWRDAVLARFARAERRGTHPQAFVDRPGAGPVGAAEQVATEDASFSFGDNATQEQGAADYIAKMRKPEKKAWATAFLDYLVGRRDDRPKLEGVTQVEADDIEKHIADRFGLARDYTFDVAGRDQARPLGGKRSKGGREPDALFKARLKRNMSVQEASDAGLKVFEQGAVDFGAMPRQTETPEFKKWFGNSKIVDESGAPRAVFHGSHGAVDSFAPFAHFGNVDAANARIADTEAAGRTGEARVTPVFLRIENPLRVRDLGVFSPIEIAAAAGDESLRKAATEAWVATLSEKEAARVLKLTAHKLQYESKPQLVSELMTTTPSEATDALYGGDARDGGVMGDQSGAFSVVADALRALGHDGLVYENEREGPRADSYVILDPSQARSAISAGSLRAPKDESGDPARDYWQSFDKRTGEAIGVHGGEMTEAAVRAAALRIDLGGNAAKIPDAPLKTTWDEMVAKRLLRKAAEEGFDRIGFTTGEQQAERYDLSKQVREVIYTPATKSLTVWGSSGKIHEEIVPDESRIEALIGKDAAKNLLAAKPEFRGGSDAVQVLDGEGLKVGGEGMKVAYDRRIPSVFEKLVKKFGGKVSKEAIQGEAGPRGGYFVERSSQGHFFLTSNDNSKSPTVGPFATREEAQSEAVKRNQKEVWTVTIPEDLRKLVVAEGMPLFQGDPVAATTDPSTARGYTTIAQEGLNRVFTVALNKSADLSTFLHESGHVFLEMMGSLAARPDAPARLKNDLATARKWMGVAEGAALETVHHEKFARAFEAYLMTGKAPSAKLVGAFESFKLWLKEIYKHITALDSGINDEIRGVFDRLLATDEEIASAQKRLGLDKPLLAPDDFADPAGYQAYLDEQKEAASHAARQGELTAMKDRLRAQEQWWKDEERATREKAEAEYEQLPARIVQSLLNGHPTGDWLGVRVPLDRKVVESVVGKDDAKKFHIAKDGAHPDEVLDGLGPQFAMWFSTGEQMLKAVVALKPKDEWVKEQTDQRMNEKHPDVLADRTKLRAEVEKGLNGDQTASWLLREYNAFASKSGGRGGFLDAAFRRAAELIVAKRTVGKLDAGGALRAERTASDKAAKAAAKGDFAQAAVHKREQLVNLHLHRELLKAREERDAFEALAGRLDKDSARKRIGKTSPVLRDGIDSVLEGVGYSEVRDRETQLPSVAEVAQAIESFSGTVQFDPAELDRLLAKQDPSRMGLAAGNEQTSYWKELTVAEMRLVSGALKNIDKVASNAGTVILDEKRADKAEVIDQLLNEARANLPQVPLLPEKSFRSLPQKVIGGLRSIDGSLLNEDTMVETLGGLNNLDSTWYRAIIKPLKDAKAKEVDLLHGPIKRVLDAFEAMPKKIQARAMERIDGAALFPDHKVRSGQPIPVPSFRAQLLIMALNAGTDSSRQRLMEGRNITEEQLAKAIDLLTKEEMDWVQSVWDATEELKEPAFALEERDSGLRPESIPNRPLVTRHGTYTGKYYPAVYDRAVEAAGETQAASQLAGIMDPSFVLPGVPHNYVKSRVEGFTGALSLEPGTIAHHLAQVAHDVSYREAIKSIGSLILDGKIQAELKNRLGAERSEQFLQWLKDVGQMRGMDMGIHAKWYMNAVKFVRGNTVIAALGLSLPNAIEDLSNLVAVIPATELKTRHLAAGLAEFAKAPLETVAMVEEKSGEMRARRDNLQRELTQRIKKLTLDGNLAGNAARYVKDHAFIFMEFSERATATPIWVGAYRQGLFEGKGEKGAIALADHVVGQIYASYNAADKAAVLRDTGFVGTTFMFGSFLNKSYNVMRRIAHPVYVAQGAAETSNALGRAGFRMLGYIVAFGVLSEFLRGRGKEDDEDWAQWFLRKLAVAPFAPVPVLGDAASGFEALVLHKQPNNRTLSLTGAGIAAVAAGFKFGKTILDGPEDEDAMKRLAEEAIRAQGPLIGLPATGPLKPFSYFMGDSEARGPFDAVGGAIYGQHKGNPANPLTVLQDVVSGPR